MAFHRRNSTIEVKRQKDIKHLSKWDEFRVRRDAIFFKYLTAKQMFKQGSILAKKAKVYLVIRKAYKAYKSEQARRNYITKMNWAVWYINKKFIYHLKLRFTTGDP